MANAAAAASGEFEFGRVFADTFRLLRQNWATYLAISAVAVALPTLASGWLSDQLVAQGAIDPTGPVGRIEANYLDIALISLTGLVLNGAVLYGAMGYFDGRRRSANECLSAGFSNWPGLFALNWLVGLALIGGFLLFIVPGVILSLAWYVVSAVRVVEGRPIMACFGRSAELTRGHRWALFGFSIVMGLITFALGLVGGFIGGFTAGLLKTLAATQFDPQLIGLPLTYLFTFPVQVAAIASAYACLARRDQQTDDVAAVFA